MTLNPLKYAPKRARPYLIAGGILLSPPILLGATDIATDIFNPNRIKTQSKLSEILNEELEKAGLDGTNIRARLV